ncbi:F-box/TPR repeat protein-like protein [Emericellopsis cladophorae]|uniref:F-box/TPR repeat protein-like protein n=1 Tax=Emericellopsis cladophorae TaxID=2686198 RepID=A0A9Q0BEY1_9HYPO|nr:F-box/TPR repeat protein-like protein [Emericellopsis cladophorae]KAI6781699.1 F-box/TPR repeat protein-like protein [Emericellopsis cladophorae]
MKIERDPTVEALIHDGRQAYAAKRFKQALECFTRFEKIAADNRSVFHEAIGACHCSVGKEFGTCDNSLHIQALDHRAASFEALKELGRAKKDAEWILELAPRALDGYLRLGKVAGLQKNYEFAWKVYNSGLEAAASTDTLASHPKLQKLHMLRRPYHHKFFKQDPLQLPLDIVHIILSFISYRDLIMCTCVCWPWRKSLTSPENRPLWRTMELAGKAAKGWRSPTQQAILKYLANSGHDIRRLTLANMKKYYINNAKLHTIFRAARNLEYLDMREQMETIKCPSQVWPKRIAHLRLIDIDFEPEFIDAVAGSVVNLDLQSSVVRPFSLFRQHPQTLEWSNLRYLRMSSAYTFSLLIDLPPLMPNLEQLWVNDVGGRGRSSDDSAMGFDLEQRPDIKARWAGKLKVFVYGESELRDIHPESLVHTLSVNNGDTLQHVDITAGWYDPPGLSFMGEAFSDQEIMDLCEDRSVMPRPRDLNTYANLRSLRLQRVRLDGEGARRMLQKPLNGGKLSHFDIVFPSLGYTEAEGPESVQRLRDFAWLQGAESIRSLGVFEFRFRRHPRNDDDLPLKGFLATFPHLEELEASSVYYDEQEFCMVLGDIILATKLKRIYQSVVKGAWLDRLRVAAAQNGVEIMFGPRPREWPVQVL